MALCLLILLTAQALDLSPPVHQAVQSVKPGFALRPAKLTQEFLEPLTGVGETRSEVLQNGLVRNTISATVAVAQERMKLEAEELSWGGLITLEIRGRAGESSLNEETLEFRWIETGLDPAKAGSKMRYQRLFTKVGEEGKKVRASEDVTCTAEPGVPAKQYLAPLAGIAYPVHCVSKKDGAQEQTRYLYLSDPGVMVEISSVDEEGTKFVSRIRALER